MDYVHATNEYTTKLLERMYFNIPPLVPRNVVAELQTTLNDLTVDHNRSALDIEDLIITFGKLLWPYTQAFEELCGRYEAELGEKLLRQKASYGLRRTYEHYVQTGGTWRALYTGAIAPLFTAEERIELHQILVDIHCDVRTFARQAALINDRTWYEERVAHYHELSGRISSELQHLRELAESETDEPTLASEIQGQIRGFELGLVKLGPQFDYDALCRAHEHFQGRKRDLKIRV